MEHLNNSKMFEAISKDFSKSENYVYISFNKEQVPNITG